MISDQGQNYRRANNQQGIIGAYAAMNTEMGILFNSVVADEVKVAEFYNSATVHEWPRELLPGQIISKLPLVFPAEVSQT